MTYDDMTKVGYADSCDETKTKPLKNDQFPGNKMPQGDTMQKSHKVIKNKRHGEHR